MKERKKILSMDKERFLAIMETDVDEWVADRLKEADAQDEVAIAGLRPGQWPRTVGKYGLGGAVEYFAQMDRDLSPARS